MVGESEILHELQRYFWHGLGHSVSHVNQPVNRTQPLTHLKVKYLNSFTKQLQIYLSFLRGDITLLGTTIAFNYVYIS